MQVNEESQEVTVSKVYVHRNMMAVFDMVTAGYAVIVTAYGKPIARITKEGGFNAGSTN